MRLVYHVIVGLLIFAGPPGNQLLAQDTAELLPARSVTISSRFFDEERQLLVSLPPGYDTGDRRHPVLVVFDAREKLPPVLAAARWLAGRGHLPDLIVVGLVNASRTRDLMPPEIAAPGTENKASDTVAFLREEMLPWVDRSYRTTPFRVLWGHSLGGMMTMHVLIVAANLFDGFIAISPDLARSDYAMVNALAASFEHHQGRPERLFVAVGDEYPLMISGVKRLEAALLAERSRGISSALQKGRSLAEARQEQAIIWQVASFETLDHDSILLPATHQGLLSIFERWRLPLDQDSVEAVEAHFRRISDMVGYEISADESTLLGLVAYPLFFDQRYARAAEVFRYAAKRFPHSHRPEEGLGKALRQLGKLSEAQAAFERALEKPGLSEQERQKMRRALEAMRGQLSR